MFAIELTKSRILSIARSPRIVEKGLTPYLNLDDDFVAHLNSLKTMKEIQEYVSNFLAKMSLEVTDPRLDAIQEEIKATINYICKCGRTPILEVSTKHRPSREYFKCQHCTSHCYLDEDLSNSCKLKVTIPFQLQEKTSAIFHPVTLFPKDVPHVLFTKPQQFFDWITELISSCGASAHSNISKKKKTMAGFFDKNLLDKLKRNNASIDSDQLLEFLNHLHLIVECNSLYIIPRALNKMKNPLACICRNVPNGNPIFFSWKDSKIPKRLFPALVVYFLNNDVEYELTGESYQNKVELNCYHIGGKLFIIENDGFLGFAYTGLTYDYPKVYDIVHQGIVSVNDKLGWSGKKSCNNTPLMSVQCTLEKCQKRKFHLAWINSNKTCITCNQVTEELKTSPWISGKADPLPPKPVESVRKGSVDPLPPNPVESVSTLANEVHTHRRGSAILRPHTKELTRRLAQSEPSRLSLTTGLYSKSVIDCREKKQIEESAGSLLSANILVTYIIDRMDIDVYRSEILEEMDDIENLQDLSAKIRKEVSSSSEQQLRPITDPTNVSRENVSRKRSHLMVDGNEDENIPRAKKPPIEPNVA